MSNTSLQVIKKFVLNTVILNCHLHAGRFGFAGFGGGSLFQRQSQTSLEGGGLALRLGQTLGQYLNFGHFLVLVIKEILPFYRLG